MNDDFNVISDQDKRQMAYGLCVLGFTATGATLGSLAGGQTLLGAAGGAVWGLFTCRHLEAPLKRKLFSKSSRLTEAEFRAVLVGTQRQFPLATRQQVFDLVARARIDATRFSSRYRC